jgi:hypothetical protein
MSLDFLGRKIKIFCLTIIHSLRKDFFARKKPERNDVKASLYNQVMNQYERNGWSRPLSQEEVEAKDKPKYYLPHHGVYRPEKKSTPLRVVFDPACQYQGVSLNSCLYKGPCLIGNLLGVLLRFRSRKSCWPCWRYIEDVFTDLPARRRHACPPILMERFR